MARPHLPRIVTLLAMLALLVWVNREAPRIVPAVLTLLVLYAALTNLERTESLFAGFENSLGRLVRPSTPPARVRGARPS